MLIFSTLTSRTPCPGCTCGFGEDSQLFPHLTRSAVREILSGVYSGEEFSIFLRTHLGVNPNASWQFPHGVCKKVREEILEKMRQLNVPEVSHNPVTRTLSWKDPDFLDGKSPWIGEPALETMDD